VRIEQDSIYFDNLVRPDPDMVGKTKHLVAIIPAETAFVATNAPGKFREVENFIAAETLGKETADSVKNIFTMVAD